MQICSIGFCLANLCQTLLSTSHQRSFALLQTCTVAGYPLNKKAALIQIKAAFIKSIRNQN
jgi:hypothetical protein